MNHLNIFNAFKNLSNAHEDELTRSFLILIKNIPIVQTMFFEMVRDNLNEIEMDTSNVNELKIEIDALAKGELEIEEVYTQVTNKNYLFEADDIEGRSLLSILISDDKFYEEFKIENDDRSARHDGVITANPNWIFIIENKPSKANVWARQLNPNISENKEVFIVDQPCLLSWRPILENLNILIIKNKLIGLEKQMVSDFVEFVDNEFPRLNPYTKFGVCKSDNYLLNRRCVSIMSEIIFNGKQREVNYHRGWGHYIDSGEETIKKISLVSEVEGIKNDIKLWLYAGDTMNAARATYKDLDIKQLLQLESEGFNIAPNFHFSFSSSNLAWFTGGLTITEYLRFWDNEQKRLKQIKRPEFEEYFNYLVLNKVVLESERQKFNEKIMSKKYPTLNVCPGFSIQYTWSEQEAIELDNNDEFNKDLEEKLSRVFSIVNNK